MSCVIISSANEKCFTVGFGDLRRSVQAKASPWLWPQGASIADGVPENSSRLSGPQDLHYEPKSASMWHPCGKRMQTLVPSRPLQDLHSIDTLWILMIYCRHTMVYLPLRSCAGRSKMQISAHIINSSSLAAIQIIQGVGHLCGGGIEEKSSRGQCLKWPHVVASKWQLRFRWNFCSSCMETLIIDII